MPEITIECPHCKKLIDVELINEGVNGVSVYMVEKSGG